MSASDGSEDLLQLVMDGMGWDKKKAQLWFNTPNPLLGGATPNGYELTKGKDRLLKFIKNQLSENKPMENKDHIPDAKKMVEGSSASDAGLKSVESHMTFLEMAGKGCVGGMVSEWQQLKPACAFAHKRIAELETLLGKERDEFGKKETELMAKIVYLEKEAKTMTEWVDRFGSVKKELNEKLFIQAENIDNLTRQLDKQVKINRIYADALIHISASARWTSRGH